MAKDLFDSNSAMYVLGHIMQEPKTLNNDKFLLTLDDFTKTLYKIVFGAIYNLAADGAQKIYPQDVDLYVAQYAEQYKNFQDEKGLEFLMQLEKLELGYDEAIFTTHYNRLKKFTILRQLEYAGIDTTEFYDPNVDIFKIDAQNEKFNRLELSEIIDMVRLKLAKIEKTNINKSDEYQQDAADGLRDLLNGFKVNPEVGPSMEGDMLNYIVRGARYGKSYLISAPTSGGKTRFMMGNMCRFAFPRIEGDKLCSYNNLHKVYYITTEQQADEMQTLIVSYVSGVPEDKILYNMTTPAEDEKIEQAVQIIEKYRDNFIIDMIPNPNMTNVRAKILEAILDKGVDMVCYDYIFIPGDDDGKASNHQYRSDQLLMMLSNQLKELAAVYNIFMLTATQVNGSWEQSLVRNQNMIRDGKSIADKVDIGMIAVRCTEEEWAMVEPFFKELNITTKPNVVIDIYKNRRGKITNAKIFRSFDFSTCRGVDLLVTTQSYRLIDNIGTIEYKEQSSITLKEFFDGGSN